MRLYSIIRNMNIVVLGELRVLRIHFLLVGRVLRRLVRGVSPDERGILGVYREVTLADAAMGGLHVLHPRGRLRGLDHVAAVGCLSHVRAVSMLVRHLLMHVGRCLLQSRKIIFCLSSELLRY